MISFKKYLKTIIKEDNVAGNNGVFGGGASFDHGGDVGNEDFYNKGSAVIPFVLGKKKKTKKKLKKK